VSVTITLTVLMSMNTSAVELGGEDRGASAVETTADAEGNGVAHLEKSLETALGTVAALAAATCCVVLLYKHRMAKLITGYMMLSSFLLFGVLARYMLVQLLAAAAMSWDALSVYLAVWNFAAVGVYAVFIQRGVPPAATQWYLICISVFMAWQLRNFDDWTGWCLLILLALWDLFAVLSPWGPLRALVNLMKERDEPMPGLLYEAKVTEPHPEEETQASSSATTHVEARQCPSPAAAGPEESIKLGLGDFVFYSLLVSKASSSGFVAGATCFLVILCGLAATLMLLSFYQKALPALPISIALGVVFFWLATHLIDPYLRFLQSAELFL